MSEIYLVLRNYSEYDSDCTDVICYAETRVAAEEIAAMLRAEQYTAQKMLRKWLNENDDGGWEYNSPWYGRPKEFREAHDQVIADIIGNSLTLTRSVIQSQNQYTYSVQSCTKTPTLDQGANA